VEGGSSTAVEGAVEGGSSAVEGAVEGGSSAVQGAVEGGGSALPMEWSSSTVEGAAATMCADNAPSAAASVLLTTPTQLFNVLTKSPIGDLVKEARDVDPKKARRALKQVCLHVYVLATNSSAAV